MPELGKYATEVTSAYIATIVLLAVLCVATFVRSRRVKQALQAAEARRSNG